MVVQDGIENDMETGAEESIKHIISLFILLQFYVI